MNGHMCIAVCTVCGAVLCVVLCGAVLYVVVCGAVCGCFMWYCGLWCFVVCRAVLCGAVLCVGDGDYTCAYVW